jgi:hypothetical protein
LIAAALAVAAVGGAFWLGFQPRPSERGRAVLRRRRRAIAASWGPARRAELARQPARAAGRTSPRPVPRVVATLDRYADAWVDAPPRVVPGSRPRRELSMLPTTGRSRAWPARARRWPLIAADRRDHRR